MRARMAHISLQFSDSYENRIEDIESIFSRATNRYYAWITGTEAGASAPGTAEALVRIGEKAGYRLWVPASYNEGPGKNSDCWIAVRENLIHGGWKTEFVPVIPGSGTLYAKQGLDPNLKPRWAPKGVTSVSFNNRRVGEINIAAAHYLTRGTNPDSPPIHGVDHWIWNKKLANAVTRWAEDVARGRDLGFYGGDQNMSDKNLDTFFGGPITSAGDELQHWESTGHGPIDVIASYNRDKRVRALTWETFNDKEFPLNTDHFLCEAYYEIADLPNHR